MVFHPHKIVNTLTVVKTARWHPRKGPLGMTNCINIFGAIPPPTQENKALYFTKKLHSDIFYLWTLQLTKIPKTCHVQYTPVRLDISPPKCPTHSREMSDKFESQHPLTPTIWSDIVGTFRVFGRTWEWIFKDFFLHFSRWTCQTFCDRCVFVSVLSFRCVECPGT